MIFQHERPEKTMSKQLIIAEKPSVAGDIARALGGFKRHDDYFESDDLRPVFGGRPLCSNCASGRIRGQARQMDVCQPAGDPAAF